MNEKRDNGLPNLYETLADASEVIVAFVNATRNGIEPPESLLQAADQALIDTVAWRRTIKQVLDTPALMDEPPELH